MICQLFWIFCATTKNLRCMTVLTMKYFSQLILAQRQSFHSTHFVVLLNEYEWIRCKVAQHFHSLEHFSDKKSCLIFFAVDSLEI